MGFTNMHEKLEKEMCWLGSNLECHTIQAGTFIINIVSNHIKQGVSLRVLCVVDTGYELGRSLGDCRSVLKCKVWVAKVRARTHTCDVRSHMWVCVQNDLWNKCAKCVRVGFFSTGHTYTRATTHFSHFLEQNDQIIIFLV